MGRRKQFCPQKTGIPDDEPSSHESKEPKAEEEDEGSHSGDEDEISSLHQVKEEDNGEQEEDQRSVLPPKRLSFEESNNDSSPKIPTSFGVSTNSDFASTFLAAQQSLFHPAALLSLNPSSLYAVQLAQLQAAQLLSRPPLKRKLQESSSEDSPSPSPLDLSGGPSSKVESSPSPKRPSVMDSLSDMSVGKSGNKPRHSAWQSQWINRGEENAKDIFKCTWCKECFHSFQALTHHMKESKHFGPSPVVAASPVTPPTAPPPPSPPKYITPSNTVTTEPDNTPGSSKKRDILKEQLPIPRKLVRGQDVWLGKGEEQTRNILKCMWCGESFRSLDVMTRHMQETKHYTKVISQDQISSWKSSPLPNSSAPNGSLSTPAQQPPSPSSSPNKDNNREPTSNIATNSSAMSSILTCKVCETSFPTLKDLSEHMIKNNHCISSPPKASPGKNPSPPAPPSNSHQHPGMNFSFPPKEKRKKSLPVKKLLELERSHEKGATMKFPCDKCGISFPFHLFADHIRNCNGSVPSSPERRPESLSPHSNPQSRASPSLRHSEGRSCSRDGNNILGSLEQMVSGNFKGAPSNKDDVVIPVIKDGQDEDIAVDEDVPPPKASKEGGNKNPLEALQMLCDKNEKHTQNYYAGGAHGFSMGGSSSPPEASSMGFPWCPSPEALFKCPFCETPFVSKGAYRNHLSKMHFVKDPSVMMMMDPASIMALAAGIPAGFFPGGAAGIPTSLGGFVPQPPASPEIGEENSSSKFEKYSQLAKQLSNQRKPLSSPA